MRQAAAQQLLACHAVGMGQGARCSLQVTFVDHCGRCRLSCSDALAALSASKQQLRKQLQRMQASDTQVAQQLSDTQQVVAKEFATLRRHMQLVSRAQHQGWKLARCMRSACASRWPAHLLLTRGILLRDIRIVAHVQTHDVQSSPLAVLLLLLCCAG
jgi:hypothetical protein